MLEQYQQARLSRDKRFDGRFVVAVLTTGIFCRPICPARLPKEDNVRYYPLPEQAIQAGFRPCLRCRPDAAPQSYAWLGNQTTVQRALRLLRNQPEQTLSDLTIRLGISERYLRSLFQRYVGLSPQAYQINQRLLLAKQLLQQTALSIDAIALACGFSAARGLQQQFKRRFALTPSQCRTERTVPADAVHLFISCSAGYHWPFVRAFLAKRAVSAVETVTDHSYQRVVREGEDAVTLTATYDPQKNGFQLMLMLRDATTLPALLANVRRVLDCDAPSDIIYQALQHAGLKDMALQDVVRIPGVWSVFEAGCRAILGQQVSLTAAVKLLNQLVNLCMPCSGFPTPQQVLACDIQQLRMPEARKRALRDFASLAASASDEQIMATMCEIKGIGPWTRQYVMLRGCSEPDIWLENDLVIKKQVKHYGVNAANCSPWRSYLTLQLWSLA